MDCFRTYLESIKDDNQRSRMAEILEWMGMTFPQLEGVIKWKQPMFIDHNTFIIAFSLSNTHISFSLESYIMDLFSMKILASGYQLTKNLAKIKWTDTIDYSLLEQLISYNMNDKKTCTTFFR